MSNPAIRTESTDNILRITIDRQDKLNAINRAMIRELTRIFAAAGENPDVRVVILTGAGPKAFIAGADIAELNGLDAEAAEARAREGQQLSLTIQQLGKPVIAAVNGWALGGGCEMALACTLRIASSNAMLGLPEVKLGVLPGYGGTQRMARLVPRAVAMEMALTGDPVDAQRALALGLVNRVVEPDELASAVDALAGKLARSAPIAMRCIMDAINRGADMALKDGLALEASYFGEVFNTEDMREGTSAFLEKRKPEFQGR